MERVHTGLAVGLPGGRGVLSRDVACINDTPSLVPYGDRYDTTTAVEATGVRAHPTLGAVFALLAASDTIAIPA